MEPRVTIEGLGKLQAALARKAAELHAASVLAVAAEVDAVRDDAEQGAPVGPTGDLRKSIEGEADGTEGKVETRLRYAGFVEGGTFKDPAQPFMAPAAERSRRRFPIRAGAIIKSRLEGR